jgi:hypothetical protein
LVATNLPSTGHGPFSASLMNECSRFTSIQDVQVATIVGIYPNPTTNVITLQLIGEDLPLEFWVFVSSEGKETRIVPNAVQSPSGSTLLVFDVALLPTGTYTIYSPEEKSNWNAGFIKN